MNCRVLRNALRNKLKSNRHDTEQRLMKVPDYCECQGANYRGDHVKLARGCGSFLSGSLAAIDHDDFEQCPNCESAKQCDRSAVAIGEKVSGGPKNRPDHLRVTEHSLEMPVHLRRKKQDKPGKDKDRYQYSRPERRRVYNTWCCGLPAEHDEKQRA